MDQSVKFGYLGVGRYLPPHILTNAHLEAMVDTSDEWIRQRTGICTRHIMGEGETLTTMAVSAARAAIDNAGIDVSDISVIRVGVNTHMRFPSLASLIEVDLGIKNISASDISAGCSAFIFGVEDVYNRLMAEYFIEGKLGYGLVIGVDGLSMVTDWGDRSTCVLFGDGAGAVIVGPVESGEILSIITRTHGENTDLLYLDEFLSVPLADPESMRFASRNGVASPYLRMEGRRVFPVAVRSMMADIHAVIEKYNARSNPPLSLADIQYVIPHQANLRIVAAVQEGLKFSEGQVYRDGVINYGNTSAASIPIAYADEWGKRPGAVEVDVAFGAGFASGAILRRVKDRD